MHVNQKNLLILTSAIGLSEKKFFTAKTLKQVTEGAKTTLLEQLPPFTCKNALCAIYNDEILTDSLPSWVNAGSIAGPFDSPALPDFRCNILIAKGEKFFFEKDTVFRNDAAPEKF